MKPSLDWPAPAKLNLMLRVCSRRQDGYHELQTVFQFLQLQDQLSFIPRNDGKILLHNPLHGVAPSTDLTFRAARLLQQATGCGMGVEISLEKRIPLGGGLGGGSSDAATTLMALNHIWRTGLTAGQLAKLALALGADVPVFLHGNAVWAEGVGERFTDFQPPQAWYLVLTPDCHVSTAAIFADPHLTRHSPRIKIRDFLQGDRRNDCLPVVRKRYPEVAAALDWLDTHATAQLTGTGACLFAAFADHAQARAVYDQLPDTLTGFVTKGLNRSPLIDRVSAD